jgi:hypothetical protein
VRYIVAELDHLVAIEAAVCLLEQRMIAVWVCGDVCVFGYNVLGQMGAEITALSSLQRILDGGRGNGGRVRSTSGLG